MGIIVRRKKSDYVPPPEGLYQAVCCDVLEPWIARNPFRPGETQEKTRIYWQLDEVNEKTGRPFEISQTFTFSLHEKSNLCQVLEKWRGRGFTDEEKEGFDLESLLGANCQLQVIHNISDGGDVYANVGGILPLMKGTTKLAVSQGYQRHKDRKGYAPPKNETPAPAQAPTNGGDNDDLPF